MSGVPFIEYLNVRIKSRRSQLFERGIYEDLLTADNIEVLVTFLLDTPQYQQYIEQALERYGRRKGLERGVTAQFAGTVASLLAMAEGRYREYFRDALFSFELRNIRTTLVTYYRGIPFSEVRSMLIPCGSFSIEEIGSAYEEGIDALEQYFWARNRLLGRALREAQREAKHGEPVIALVNRLDQRAYQQIAADMKNHPDDAEALRGVLRFEIDMKNVIAALKIVWEHEAIKHRKELSFAMGGSITIEFLEQLCQAGSLDEAFEMVEQTPFGPAVEKGIIYYAETGFLHEMERFFEEVFIAKTQTYRRIDTFGLGVFIGYVWAHYVELTNLRTIINGIAFRTGGGQIRKGLIYV